MKLRNLVSVVLVSSCLVLAANAATMRVGRAAVKITPPVGSPMGNSYGLSISQGVHDDLYAKALVLEQDGVKTAIVACDTVSLRGAIVAEARRLIESKTSLKGAQVIISATHCHAGPQMHPLFLKQVGGKGEQMGLEYISTLPGLIAESVGLAEADLTPARVSATMSSEKSLVFNRRFLMKDGSVRMNPGRLNPQSVRPVGDVDAELSVVYFESLESKPLVTLVNYPLHVAIVGGNRFSSDYPGVLSRMLAEVKGKDMLTIFTNGTSGNVNHIDSGRKDQLSGNEEAARIGIILASAVLKSYPALQPIDTQPLKVRTDKVDLPVASVSEREVAQARETMSRYGKPNGPSFDDVVRAWRILDLEELKGKPLETEVQAITLGDELAYVGFPGDAFVELGLSIKTNSPFPLTIVSEQSGNGAISYVPNQRAFPEGGYEVNSARFLPGGAELLIDAAGRLLTDLFPYGKVRGQKN